MEKVGILFYGHLEYFTAIWWQFGIHPPVLVNWVKDNLATRFQHRQRGCKWVCWGSGSLADYVTETPAADFDS
jgi:hypothetical protein